MVGEIPDPILWQGPMSWTGSPLKAVANYSRSFPANAVFVRAELIFQLSMSTGPGIIRSEERALPGLIRLEKGKAVEVHAVGPDGGCWTYRKQGRRWLVGVPLSAPSFAVEQVVVQSVLPMEGTGKVISFVIAGGKAEDLSRAVDPDPGD